METKFSERFGPTLRRLREARGISPSDLARALKVDRANVSHYEAGKYVPSFDTFRAIARELGLSPAELMAEVEGEPGAPSSERTVPLISWVAAGGWADVIDNLQPGQGERIRVNLRPRRHTFALRVRGDSMEPEFPDGSVIVVEPEEDAQPGGYVIVRQNQDSEVTFKQLVRDGGKLFLRPLNPRYPILELSPDATICGVVKEIAGREVKP